MDSKMKKKEGHAGVLRHVVSGHGGGQQGGPCLGRTAGRIASGEAAARGGLGAWLWDIWAALGRTWARVVGHWLMSGDMELVGGTSESSGAHPDRVGPV